MDIRWLISISLNILVIWSLECINFTLSSYGLIIAIPALWIVFSSLYLPLKHGFLCVLLTSLLLESGFLPYYDHTLSIQVCLFFILNYIHLCRNFKTQTAYILILQATNTVFWIFTALLRYNTTHINTFYIADACCCWILSQSILAIVGSLFWRLQSHTLLWVSSKLNLEH